MLAGHQGETKIHSLEDGLQYRSTRVLQCAMEKRCLVRVSRVAPIQWKMPPAANPSAIHSAVHSKDAEVLQEASVKVLWCHYYCLYASFPHGLWLLCVCPILLYICWCCCLQALGEAFANVYLVEFVFTCFVLVCQFSMWPAVALCVYLCFHA